MFSVILLFFESKKLLPSNERYSDIEPLASNCSEVLVWHTMTYAPAAAFLRWPKHVTDAANLQPLFHNMISAGMAVNDERDGIEMDVCFGNTCLVA